MLMTSSDKAGSGAYPLLLAGQDPVLDGPQARVLRGPTAHAGVGCVEVGVDVLVGDDGQLLGQLVDVTETQT